MATLLQLEDLQLAQDTSYMSSDLDSVLSLDTRATSMLLRQPKAAMPAAALHSHIGAGAVALSNVLDCLEDMARQETRLIEEALELFVADVSESLPYNTHVMQL